MRSSRVERDGPAVLELLRRGATATEASAATGVNVNTIRAWIHRYPQFHDARRPALKVAEGQKGRAGVPDREELIELLAERARDAVDERRLDEIDRAFERDADRDASPA
jgi:transposase-like protein